jgi:hypothetical protein
MYRVRGFRRRYIDQAEDLALGLTHPVSQVSDAVRALSSEVCGVGLGDAIDSGSAVDSVDIHVKGHWCLPRVVGGRDSKSVRAGSAWLHRSHLPNYGRRIPIFRGRLRALLSRTGHLGLPPRPLLPERTLARRVSAVPGNMSFAASTSA